MLHHPRPDWRAALERPETLLKSALEKVVFFECRIDQLGSELERAEKEIARLKNDLGEAAQREVEFKREIAAAESRAAQATRERDEALRQLEATHAERERFLGRLIQAEQVRQAGEVGDGVDLAEFIAELRAEVLDLRAAVASGAPRAPRPGALAGSTPRVGSFGSAEEAAESFAAEGRLAVGEPEREALRASARFGTRSEETLFTLSLRELSSPESATRVRAAGRLKTLGARAALPAVAAALNSEPSPEARCALLEVVAAAEDRSVLPLVRPHLESDSVEVRLAALEAAFRLDDEGCLERALDDASPLVRRRAAVLATGDARGQAVLARAARDADPSVRRVAALGQGAAAGERAEASLLSALDDADASVRRAAAKGLRRSMGPEVFAVADLDAARRRREIRRLSSSPRPRAEAFAQAAVERLAQLPAAEVAVATPVLTTAPAAATQASPPTSAAAPRATAQVAAPPAPASAPTVDERLAQEILGRVYSALRGQSPEELTRGMSQQPELVFAAATALERQGRLVRRGQRYFVP
jgi:HEAT repeat protein